MDGCSRAFCDWLRRTCSRDDTWFPARIVYLYVYFFGIQLQSFIFRFNIILVSRSFPQLKATFDEYAKVGDEFHSSIQQNFESILSL